MAALSCSLAAEHLTTRGGTTLVPFGMKKGSMRTSMVNSRAATLTARLQPFFQVLRYRRVSITAPTAASAKQNPTNAISNGTPAAAYVLGPMDQESRSFMVTFPRLASFNAAT